MPSQAKALWTRATLAATSHRLTGSWTSASDSRRTLDFKKISTRGFHSCAIRKTFGPPICCYHEDLRASCSQSSTSRGKSPEARTGRLESNDEPREYRQWRIMRITGGSMRSLTYTPKMREIIIPDASGLTPRPFWRRSVSIVLAAFVVVLASVVLSLGL